MDPPVISKNLIRNGDFTNGPYPSIFPWVITGVIDVIPYEWLWLPKQYGRCVDLEGTCGLGGISQNFQTSPGISYLVTLMVAGNADGGPINKTMKISAGNTFKIIIINSQIYHAGGAGVNRMPTWETITWIFKATSTSTTLALQSIEKPSEGYCYGPMVANIKVMELIKK
jgi:hypothetical protein